MLARSFALSVARAALLEQHLADSDLVRWGSFAVRDLALVLRAGLHPLIMGPRSTMWGAPGKDNDLIPEQAPPSIRMRTKVSLGRIAWA